MAKPKASKGINTTALVASILAAYDSEVAARRARITALREFCKAETQGALSDVQAAKIRDDLKDAYASKGLKDKSAFVMALQDVRFIKAYTSDATFRAGADKQDSVTACFLKPGSANKNSALKKAFRAIKKAKLDNRTVALEFIATHPERAIVLIENHLRELSQVGAQLKAVSSRSVPKQKQAA